RFLRATVASIPGTDEVGSYGLRSGWDSADGWSDFLAYARQARPIRFVPDADAPSEYVPCLLVEPWQEPPEPGWAVRRTITLLLRATDPSIPFEGY
ncbi:MAG TPA: hypothetical protein VEB59_10310, partial [Gemmatimonadales bacterium]|nr:hypothetical protein [Gemmatimonadales bacterium]